MGRFSVILGYHLLVKKKLPNDVYDFYQYRVCLNDFTHNYC